MTAQPQPDPTDAATRERLLAVCEAYRKIHEERAEDRGRCVSKYVLATDDPETGYEAALRKIGELTNALDKLRPCLNDCVDGENYLHGIKGGGLAKRQFRYIQSQIAVALLVLEPRAEAAKEKTDAE